MTIMRVYAEALLKSQERTGPCVNCGKPINWLDEYCPNCEQEESERQWLVDERETIIAKIVEAANALGWTQLGPEEFYCPNHTPEGGAPPVKMAQFSNIAEDFNTYSHFALDCSHQGCLEVLQKDLPTPHFADDTDDL